MGLNDGERHIFRSTAVLVPILLCVLTSLGVPALAATKDIIINNFKLVREGLVDEQKRPTLNLLGYKTEVQSDTPAWVSEPVLLFSTDENSSFETFLGSEGECNSYSGFKALEIDCRFASGDTSNFTVTIETCGNGCNNNGSEYCDESENINKFYVDGYGGGDVIPEGLDELYDWNRIIVDFNGPQGLGNTNIYSIKLSEFSKNVWFEIGAVKLIADGSSENEIQQGDVTSKYIPKNDDYIIDDFLDNHRYITQKNYHGHYTSDDWTNLNPAIAAHGALWLTTKPEAYWYTSLGLTGQSLDISAHKYLCFFVRFPFEAPVPLEVLIENGTPGVRSKYVVDSESVGTKLENVHTWQHVAIPLDVIPGLNQKAVYSVSITGYTETIVVHYGMMKFTSDPARSKKEDAKILPEIISLPDINLKYTVDGTCGIQNNGVNTGYMCNIKNPGIYGSCCSAQGKCGDTVLECGPGCQDGYGMCDGSKKSEPNGGLWELYGDSGVSAQHAWLEPNTNRIVFSDRQQNYETLNYNGIPHYFAVRLGLDDNKLIPVSQITNAFCSGGAWLQNNTLVMVGGHETIEMNPGNLKDGIDGIRLLYTDVDGTTNFFESDDFKLTKGRWYPTAVSLPDDRIFVISGLSAQGRNRDKVNQTWEILNFSDTSKRIVHDMPWLMRSDPYELYPYVYVLSNGRLYIRAGIHNIIFDHTKNTYEDLPDILLPGQNYPKTGSSVMLPLRKKNNWKLELVFCGGSTTVENNYFDTSSPASHFCGIVNPMEETPIVKFVTMPNRRVMGDGLTLPDGKILWINGAQSGSQGYWSADNPVYTPDLYDPATNTWTTLAPSTIERLYHSIAHLLPDGRVLVSGSTPNDPPYPVVGNFTNRYEIEIFTPPYLVGIKDSQRPVIVRAPSKVYANGGKFWIKVNNLRTKNPEDVKVMMIATGFVTHSIHMNERTLELEFEMKNNGKTLVVEAPPNIYIGVPGPYMLFVVSKGIPSIAAWISIKP